MPTNEDARWDSETPQQPPTPSPRPPVKRSEDGEGSNDESKRGSNQYCKEKPDHWSKGVEAICAIVLVFITGYYAFYARKQAASSETAAHAAENAVGVASRTLEETQRSNDRQAKLSDLARKSSEAATKDTLSATIENFHREQRAWISFGLASVGYLPPAHLPYIEVPWTNNGKTPAVHVKFGINRVPIELARANKEIIRAKLLEYFNGIEFLPNPAIPPQQTQAYDLTVKDPIDLQGKLEDIKSLCGWKSYL
jgi:hypothetical protein